MSVHTYIQAGVHGGCGGKGIIIPVHSLVQDGVRNLRSSAIAAHMHHTHANYSNIYLDANFFYLFRSNSIRLHT